MPNRKITILTGEEEWYRAHKSFNSHHDEITKISDYDIGKYFCPSVETLTPGAELMSLAEIFNRYSEDRRSFRVYGELKDFIPPREKIQRKQLFLSQPPKGVNDIMLDIDGWQTDIHWWESQDKLREAIHTMLTARGLEFFTLFDCVCMLSQGAWPHGPLKCHVHFWSEESILLDDLRLWAKCVNARLGTKAIDYSVYGEVQPHYIARRNCTNFDDPFPESFRVSIIKGNDLLLSDMSIRDGIEFEIKDTRPKIDSGEIKLDERIDFNGDGWEMVAQAGVGGQVNEWCYRAAARIVKAQGKTFVEANLNALAEQMHDIAWRGVDGLGGMADNSNGERGGADDAQVYTVDRFKQYLDSACNAQIGDALDSHLKIVRDAISSGVQSLMRREVTTAAAKLELNWPAHYEQIRAEVQSSRAVRMKTWDREVNGSKRELTRTRRVSQDEAVDAIDMLGEDSAIGDVIETNGTINPLMYFNKVLETYDWGRDINGEVGIVDRFSKERIDRGGYDVMNLMEFEGHLRLRLLEVMQVLDPSQLPPPGSVSIVSGMINHKLRVDKHQKTVPFRAWGDRVIGTRYVMTRNALWINLGEEDGELRCLRVDASGKRRLTWQQAISGWADAPVWRHLEVPVPYGRNDPNAYANFDLNAALRGGGLSSLPEGNWTEKLFRMVQITSDTDRVLVLAWLTAALLDWPTRFILQISGTQGAGKSSAAALLCALIDPIDSDRPIRVGTDSVLTSGSLNHKQISRALEGRKTAIFDNLVSLNGFQQELLCTIATGLKFVENIKYVNASRDVHIKCSVIFTGISESVTRPDLQERVLTVDIDKRLKYPNADAVFKSCWSEISDGLLDFAMKVWGVVGNIGEEDSVYGGRDGIIRACHELYLGEKAGVEVLEERAQAQNSELVSNDNFASCFCAWLQWDSDSWGPVGDLEGKRCTTSELHERYKRWLTGPMAGKSVWVSTKNGATFKAELTTYSSNEKRALPTNSVVMGRQLKKWGPSIRRILGLEGVGSDIPPPDLKMVRVKGYNYWYIKTVDDCFI